MRLKGKSDFEQLNDKEWLIQKYDIEELRAIQIAKIVNCKASVTVMDALRRFNIPTRKKPLSLREEKHICENFKIKSKRQLAKELGEYFKEDNGGSRNVITVRRFLKREKIED